MRASDVEVSATIGAATDYYFRGVSQSRNDPAVQANVAVEHSSGWFGGVFASTVDLPHGAYDSERHGDVELDASLGYGHDVGHGWAASARAVRYAYLDQDRGYDYSELGLGLAGHGLSASVGHSNEALGYGGSGTVWEVVHERPLPGALTLSAGVGWYQLQRLRSHYAFWHLAVRRSFGRFAADLGYFGSDDHGHDLFGDRARGRVVLGVVYGLR